MTLQRSLSRGLCIVLAVALIAIGVISAAGAFMAESLEGQLTQITSELYDEYHPRIDGDIVVFTAFVGNSKSIVYVNLDTGDRTQITSEPSDQMDPDVSGNRIAYVDYSKALPSVYVYNIHSSTEFRVIDNDRIQTLSPAIDGDLVVYVYTDVDDRDTRIWITDFENGTSTQVSDGSNSVGRPSVHGLLVAYEETINGDSKIVLYDLETGQSNEVMPSGSINQRRPHINGDWLVFDAFVSGRTVRDLVLYEISTGIVHHLDMDGDQSFARISGDWVSFDDDTHKPKNDIVLYNILTGLTHHITDPNSVDFFSSISGNRVVFTSNMAGKFDIWMYEFPSSVLTVSVEGNGQTFPSPGTYYHYLDTLVELNAVPSEGWKFSHWQGDVSQPNLPNTTILMDGNKAVTAVFVEDEDAEEVDIESLQEQVEGLIADGTLNRGQGRALMATLSAASRNMDKGDTEAACDLLEAFIKQVEAFMRAGILSEEEGQELIAEAEALIKQLRGANSENIDVEAYDLLNTIISEAEDFVKTGVMEETEGTELINEAKRLMNQISNGD